MFEDAFFHLWGIAQKLLHQEVFQDLVVTKVPQSTGGAGVAVGIGTTGMGRVGSDFAAGAGNHHFQFFHDFQLIAKVGSGNRVLVGEAHGVDGIGKLFQGKVLIESDSVAIAHALIFLGLQMEGVGGFLSSDRVGNQGQIHWVGENAADLFGFILRTVLQGRVVLRQHLVTGRQVVAAGDGGVGGQGVDAGVEEFPDLVGGEGLQLIDFGGLGGAPTVERLGGEDEVALEVAFQELGDFGAGVRADFVEAVDADVQSTAIDQALQEVGILGVALQFGLDRFQYADFAALGGQVNRVAATGLLASLHQLAQVHGFAQARFPLQDQLPLEGGQGLQLAAVAGADLGVGEVVGMGILVEQVGIGQQDGAEGSQQAVAEKGNPGEQEGDITESGDVADPGIPEEDRLDLRGARIAENQADPKAEVDQQGLANGGAPLVEGDRLYRHVKVGARIPPGFEGVGKAHQQGNVLRLPGNAAIVGDLPDLAGQVGTQFGEVGTAIPSSLKNLQDFLGLFMADFLGDGFGFAHPIQQGYRVGVALGGDFDQKAPVVQMGSVAVDGISDR